MHLKSILNIVCTIRNAHIAFSNMSAADQFLGSNKGIYALAIRRVLRHFRKSLLLKCKTKYREMVRPVCPLPNNLCSACVEPLRLLDWRFSSGESNREKPKKSSIRIKHWKALVVWEDLFHATSSSLLRFLPLCDYWRVFYWYVFWLKGQYEKLSLALYFGKNNIISYTLPKNSQLSTFFINFFWHGGSKPFFTLFIFHFQ